MSLRVRLGSAADGEAAVAVWRLANAARRGGAPVPADQEMRVRAYLAKPDSFLAVAEDDGALVGMALGMQGLEEDGAGPPVAGLCHISMVFVHPARWGQGIGKLLMQRLLELGRGRGYCRFQLWTQADNQRAQQLYDGLGLRRSGREKVDDLDERVVHYELPEMAQPTGGRSMDEILQLAVAYGEAWSQRNAEAIAALHTEDSVFHLHNVMEPYVGREAIAAAAAGVFRDSPDLQFDRVRVHLGPDHFVSEYVMRGTLMGRPFACEGTDVFSVRDGLVSRKDSYIDWMTYQAQTGVDLTEQGARILPAGV